MLLTGTAAEIIPVINVDMRAIGHGASTGYAPPDKAHRELAMSEGTPIK